MLSVFIDAFMILQFALRVKLFYSVDVGTYRVLLSIM